MDTPSFHASMLTRLHSLYRDKTSHDQHSSLVNHASMLTRLHSLYHFLRAHATELNIFNSVVFCSILSKFFYSFILPSALTDSIMIAAQIEVFRLKKENRGRNALPRLSFFILHFHRSITILLLLSTSCEWS